jgi:hypothetical protein
VTTNNAINLRVSGTCGLEQAKVCIMSASLPRFGPQRCAAAGAGAGMVADGDGDSVFKLYNTTDIPDGVGGFVTLSETEIGGVDYYDVGLTWDASTGYAGGYGGGGQLVYSLAVLAGNSERIVAAAIDSAITGIGTAALARFYELPANSFITNLSSFDGAHDPIHGYAAFSPRETVGVQYTFKPSTTGVFQDAHSSFVTSVPEPASLALWGIGLLGLALTRRKTA